MACMSSSFPLSKRSTTSYQLQETPVRVDAQPELAGRIVVVQVGDIDVVLCGVDAGVFADSVFECGLMCVQAAWAQARTASRIASDREWCSCSARAFNAASNAASIRTGTTAPGSPSTSTADLPARGKLSGIVRNLGGPTYHLRRPRCKKNWSRVRASRGRYRADGRRVLN